MTNTVAILKSLTQTTYNSVEGYRKAAEIADSPALKQALLRRADQRTQTLNTLNTELSVRGEDMISDVSTMGAGHQLWMKFTTAFSEGNEKAVARIDEGESFIADQFSEVLNNDSDLDAKARGIIADVYNEISAGKRFSVMVETQYA